MALFMIFAFEKFGTYRPFEKQFNPAFDVKRQLKFRPFVFLFLYLQLRIIAAMDKEIVCWPFCVSSRSCTRIN